MPYKSFSNYVLRTPMFSFNFFDDLTSENYISEEKLKFLCRNPIIMEAIFLASPDLNVQILKWIENGIAETKDVKNLKQTLIKYLTRMSSRCTPFGLFAGCAVGTFSNRTNIQLNCEYKYARHTRIDMNFLVALAKDIVSIPRIKEQILFFPNTSIYNVGHQLRYVEYNYSKGSRVHHISAVNRNVYLEKILKVASNGRLLIELANIIVDEDISKEEAEHFVEELVENQLLISDLEPSVSGSEFLSQICNVLSEINDVDDILHVLLKAQRKMVDSIDKNIGNDSKVYLDLFDDLKSLSSGYELKFMFQTDLVLTAVKNTLNRSILETLEKGLILLNKISTSRTDNSLNEFVKKFTKRYGEAEVSLSVVLDVEVGIGFKQNVEYGDVSPLVDDIVFPEDESNGEKQNISLTSIDKIIQKKIVKAIKNEEYTVFLNDKMFEDFDAEWNDLPNTFSCMIETFKKNGKDKFKLNYLNGSSAANLLGRFCHGDLDILEHSKKILEIESKMSPNIILSEIVHLPESRVGNILMRPSLRKYEIPYLSKSLKKKKNILPIEDLMVSVKNNKILLRSKKENKEVIPYLTNAHNFSSNALPVYNFLCEIQTQGKNRHLGVNSGYLDELYEFVPRIEYESIVLREASWNLTKSDIECLSASTTNQDKFTDEISQFRNKYKIPQYIKVGHKDNLLVINFKNLDSVLLFLKIVKKMPKFSITEFLATEDTAIKRNGEYFVNQIIVSYYNENELIKKQVSHGK